MKIVNLSSKLLVHPTTNVVSIPSVSYKPLQRITERYHAPRDNTVALHHYLGLAIRSQVLSWASSFILPTGVGRYCSVHEYDHHFRVSKPGRYVNFGQDLDSTLLETLKTTGYDDSVDPSVKYWII
ncbi:unnamed protein product [Protopolystoma xenopodis]|uniref:Uncharacterized protein n=1 Tax=Protopolystoma xenopodis TaxID=117903 RepID=A0A3S5AHX5_9PLAT|nr:unnamed protein product [Protopolystoma xenopodis]